MPRFKYPSCRTRHGHREGVALVTIRPHDDQRYTDRVRDLFAGRGIIDAQTWLDAQRWLDDGGDALEEIPARKLRSGR